jgi:hypothetical protein
MNTLERKQGMEHPDEGVIRALLDHEPLEEGEELRTHLDSCPHCQAVAERQEEQLRILDSALPALDREPPTALARARVLRAVREKRTSRRGSRVPLSWAASFALLLTAGALTALPSSPVRLWWSGRGGASLDVEEEPASEAIRLSEPLSEGELVGATLLGTGQEVNLVLVGVAEGAEIRVLFVEGEAAGVFAEEGTHFRTEDGTLEAANPPGAVRVELPRDPIPLTLRVNGRILLRRTPEGLEIMGPVRSRSSDEILFIQGGNRG